MYEWRTGRSCLFKNNVHLIFVTKYRRGVFSKDMLERTEAIMKETCEQMDCELLEFGGEHDHIHMMVSVHPKQSTQKSITSEVTARKLGRNLPLLKNSRSLTRREKPPLTTREK